MTKSLQLPAGTPAIAIRDDPGGLEDEGEIVLQRGLIFRITQDGDGRASTASAGSTRK